MQRVSRVFSDSPLKTPKLSSAAEERGGSNFDRRMASVSLPRDIITQLESRGAEIRNHGTRAEPLFVIIFEQSSLAHEDYIEFCARYDNMIDLEQFPDLLVQLTPARIGAGVIPHPADQFQVFLEACAVVEAYAPLRAGHLVAGAVPGLGPPMALPLGGIRYHHSTISANAVVQRISSGVGCPVISRQSAGTVLCGISYIYANAVVSMYIVKT